MGKGKGHTCTFYTAKICHNSALGGPVNLVLGSWHKDNPPPN